jgi:hypothetical protein
MTTLWLVMLYDADGSEAWNDPVDYETLGEARAAAWKEAEEMEPQQYVDCYEAYADSFDASGDLLRIKYEDDDGELEGEWIR